MAYESVDKLQKTLAENVFHYAKDAKKASGRALGTLVEIITFYMLKSWGFEQSTAIERPIAEYGNVEITHNVEYSLHPVLRETKTEFLDPKMPLSATRIFALLQDSSFDVASFEKTGTLLITQGDVLRNSCVVAKGPYSHLTATLINKKKTDFLVSIAELHTKPYAMFECKRVGIEEGMSKGPQTIEKAKQGAYVARAVSSLQKIRTAKGTLQGIIYRPDGTVYTKPFNDLIAEIIQSNDSGLLQDFILTVGIVSNHGNWFTSDNHNKELKVLAQSYDWLIFLTDEGLAEFIHQLLLEPTELLQPAKKAFLASYKVDKKGNQFTKVQMQYDADQVLQDYFRNNATRIENWFNVIQPKTGSVSLLKQQLSTLRQKDWKRVHEL